MAWNGWMRTISSIVSETKCIHIDMMMMPINSFWRFWSKLKSFAVCLSGPTGYCERNWLSSHLMAPGLAQQRFVTEVAQSCFVWPTIHCKGPKDSEYPCQRAWKNNNQMYLIKETTWLNIEALIQETRVCVSLEIAKSLTSHFLSVSTLIVPKPKQTLPNFHNAFSYPNVPNV